MGGVLNDINDTTASSSVHAVHSAIRGVAVSLRVSSYSAVIFVEFSDRK